LTPAQELIAKDCHRFRVIRAGRRFGKTVLASLEIVAKAYAKESNIIYVATTYQQARDIAWNTLKQIAEPIALSINESRLEIKVKNIEGTGSLITLRGWENIDTLRGQKIDFAVLDEVASMRNFWENWEEVIRPTLTDNIGEVMFISTPKGFNHFYQLYCIDPNEPKAFDSQVQDSDYKSFHFTSYDNPYLKEEELEKSRAEMTDDRFAQEYLADFKKTEGLVYKEFVRDKALFDDSTKIYDPVETIAGVDFGFTNPTAVLTIIRDYTGNFWVTDEYYRTGQTDSQNAEWISSQKFNKVYADPEAPNTIKELKLRGVNVREVIKGKDSIVNGINKIKELLKAGKLHIHKRCSNTILEFETYCYPDKTEDNNPKELPIKENDHAMDALRYAIMMQPIEGERRKSGTWIPKNLNRTPQYKIT
jgi:PBSX family phage terminase large subunit